MSPRPSGESLVRPADRWCALSSVHAGVSLPLGLTSSRRPGSVVTSATLSTRLETRTKESNMNASLLVVRNLDGEVKVKAGSVRPRSDPSRSLWRGGARPADRTRSVGSVAQERSCWDPKDGELCLGRSKPEETLVEDRSDSDVQIDRHIWV